MAEAIRTEGLRRAFGGAVAVEGLTISVEEGEIFGLVGPDGAGKTTVMRLLAGILDPTDGDAWVMGRSVRGETRAVQRGIGYMSQRFGLYPDLTVGENLRFYADLYGVSRREREAKVPELLAFSGLGPFQRRLAGNLSGGMKQKLGLSCALVHTPGVLLLDEPTNGVDPVSRREFWNILYRLLKEKVTIFVSTAYLDEAERFQRLALLHEGRLLALGTPDEVRRLYPGTILEIRCADPRRGRAVLREGLPGASVGLFGDRIHAGARGVSLSADAAGKVLADAGIPVLGIRAVPPGLEDVFVSVLAAGEGGAG
ncbi:MAG: transporter related [Deltaproteobacteria bacterium]|nr:transporter related [Deltaproteobacteria bacterium]